MKKIQIRYLEEIRNVLYDKDWAKKARNFSVYKVKRGVKEKNDLRYDVTIIPPRMLGQEFVKTKGNRNWKGYQELYIVLKGEAIFLMQKSKGKIVKDIVATRTKPGDWIMIPPYYSAIIINPSKKVLKTGNWVSKKNQNIYKDIEKMKGACYYYTISGWIKNKNYKRIPKLQHKKPLKSKPKDLIFLDKEN